MIARRIALLLAAPLLAVVAVSYGRGYRITETPPYATAACFGDSIFAGACASQTVCANLKGRLPAGYATSSHARSGDSADLIAHKVEAEALTACNGEPCGTYLLEGGVNTLKDSAYVSTPDAQVVHEALFGNGIWTIGMLDAADWLHANAPRARVIISGVLPYGACTFCGTDGLVNAGARMRLYNATLTTECALRPWLTCRFPAPLMVDPSNADNLNPALVCADGIHPNDTGQGVLTGLLYGARSWP